MQRSILVSHKGIPRARAPTVQPLRLGLPDQGVLRNTFKTTSSACSSHCVANWIMNSACPQQNRSRKKGDRHVDSSLARSREINGLVVPVHAQAHTCLSLVVCFCVVLCGVVWCCVLLCVVVCCCVLLCVVVCCCGCCGCSRTHYDVCVCPTARVRRQS